MSGKEKSEYRREVWEGLAFAAPTVLALGVLAVIGIIENHQTDSDSHAPTVIHTPTPSAAASTHPAVDAPDVTSPLYIPIIGRDKALGHNYVSYVHLPTPQATPNIG